MGFFDWIAKRIFSDKTLDYLGEKLEGRIQNRLDEIAYNTIAGVLSSEEVGTMVTDYGDALFNRYRQKFWASVGGVSKGINQTIIPRDPLSEIVREDGGINLGGILRLAMSGGLKNLGQTGTTQRRGSIGLPHK